LTHLLFEFKKHHIWNHELWMLSRKLFSKNSEDILSSSPVIKYFLNWASVWVVLTCSILHESIICITCVCMPRVFITFVSSLPPFLALVASTNFRSCSLWWNRTHHLDF
jgi:hypothetical protein